MVNPHNPKYSFQLGQIVKFDVGTFSGTGMIEGVSQTQIPLLGDIVIGGGYYIVKVIEVTRGEQIPSETYPFTHITVPELNLTPGVIDKVPEAWKEAGGES